MIMESALSQKQQIIFCTFPLGKPHFPTLGICTFPKADKPGKNFLCFEWETPALSHLCFPKVYAFPFFAGSPSGKVQICICAFPKICASFPHFWAFPKNIALNLGFPGKEAQKKQLICASSRETETGICLSDHFYLMALLRLYLLNR